MERDLHTVLDPRLERGRHTVPGRQWAVGRRLEVAPRKDSCTTSSTKDRARELDRVPVLEPALPLEWEARRLPIFSKAAPARANHRRGPRRHGGRASGSRPRVPHFLNDQVLANRPPDPAAATDRVSEIDHRSCPPDLARAKDLAAVIAQGSASVHHHCLKNRAQATGPETDRVTGRDTDPVTDPATDPASATDRLPDVPATCRRGFPITRTA